MVQTSLKKCWKIPKGKSEVVNRRTNNTMAKRKRTKIKTIIHIILQRKQSTEQHESIENCAWVNSGAQKG